MPATTRVAYASGAGPTLANAETGIVLSRSEAQAPGAGVAPVPIPNSPGTNYSWPMVLALEVTVASPTVISNRKLDSNLSWVGARLWYGVLGAYRQSSLANKPPDVATQPLTTPTPTGAGAPGSYNQWPITPTVYDAAGVSANATGVNGAYVELVGGVDSNFDTLNAPFGGSQVYSNGAIQFEYDEV